MRALDLLRWSARRALSRPVLWCTAVGLALLVPLCRALSPFPGLGVDPSWDLAAGWTPPVSWLGASLAVAYLSRREGFLDLLPDGRRRLGEAATLLAAALGLLACLGLGALASEAGRGGSAAPAWALGAFLAGLHAASAGCLVLRAPGPGSLRVGLLWIALWGIPALLGPGWPGSVLAPDAGAIARGGTASGTGAVLSSLLATSILAISSVGLPTRAPVSLLEAGGRRGSTR